ncbi:MAG: redox-sensing transcriptional repressor Rex [Eubacteriales bacterium]|nr:redox-sensing transcriptional repressor Rex [Eubacteriales bacterium]
MKENLIARATLGRLPLYLQYLQTLPANSCVNISATTIAKELGLGEVQVRKDLGSVIGTGKPKIGYVTKDIISKLEKVLGTNDKKYAILVGAGKLGRALFEYKGFEDYGLEITAAFDNDETKWSDTLSGKEIYPTDKLVEYCIEHNVKIGIIAVPESAAQAVCDMMLTAGITAIWNFAPISPIVPEGVLLQQENLALSLAHLKIQMLNSDK